MEETKDDLNNETIIQRLENFSENNPHKYLGLCGEEDQVIRLYRPLAKEVFIELFSEIVSVPLVHESGLFEIRCEKKTTHLDYKIYHQNGLLDHDPYSFPSSIDCQEVEKFIGEFYHKGYELFGGKALTFKGCSGARFVVYAPHAKSVSLICETDHFDSRLLILRKAHESGVFEIFVPGLSEGERYKFEIHTQEGHRKIKTDPYGTFFELRPKQEAILYDVDQFKWEDQKWVERRKKRSIFQRPMNIYELHLGSWRKKGSQFLNYKQLAHHIVDYCQDMGYTDVELMPVTEYPYDGSWGYQVTGYFGATSRYGKPEELQYLINYLHVNEIGVIIDWVPGHFPLDEFSLAKFDGKAVYEHEDFGIHPHWTTHYFDYSKTIVLNFLMASALFWIEKYHVDGLRVDAVASIVHLDFGKKEGEWKPNKYGGKEHLDGIEFLKLFNKTLEEIHPDILRIAEDTSTFQGISHPISKGGLGFHYKWNLGLCQDVIVKYLSKDFSHRKHEYHHLVFSLEYAFTDSFLLPLSHDEVTHERKSFISKFYGSKDEKFSQYRAFLMFFLCYPGKKLVFMGQEFGQLSEWNYNEEIPWGCLKNSFHQKLQNFVKDLNSVYLLEKAFWQEEFNQQNFHRIIDEDSLRNLLVVLKGDILCCFNFGIEDIKKLKVPLKGIKKAETIFSSHKKKYGANADCDDTIKLSDQDITITLNSLSSSFIKLVTYK